MNRRTVGSHETKFVFLEKKKLQEIVTWERAEIGKRGFWSSFTQRKFLRKMGDILSLY